MMNISAWVFVVYQYSYIIALLASDKQSLCGRHERSLKRPTPTVFTQKRFRS